VPQYYRINALDNSGKFLSLSDSVQLTPFDTIKPPPPIIKYATVLNGTQIQLFWHKSIPKVKLYEVSIKSAKGQWTVVNTVKLDSQYTISGLNTPDSIYDLRIVAIDSCQANRSLNSLFHSPIQLGGDSLDDTVKLAWKPYEGFASVNKYYIYNWQFGRWKIIDSVAGNITVYYHKPLPCNVYQFYRVGALDKSGKYLSFSDTIRLTPFDTIKPPAPLLYFASVQSDNSIKVAWRWDKKSDVKYFDIFRSKNGSPFTRIKTVIYDSSYTDTDVGVTPKTDTFSYYVIAIDSCNVKNRSKASRADTTMNLNLYSFGCIPLIEIRWDAYKGLPNKPDTYEIYRSSGGSPFAKITSIKLPIPLFKFTDITVKRNIVYFYKIRAIDSKSGYSSYSDSIGMLPRIVPLPDSLQFIYSSVIKTGITSGRILLNWQRANPSDTIARGYRIYVYDSVAKKYNVLYDSKNMNDTSYIHNNINTQNKTYRYYIAAYNKCDIDGNSSVMQQPIHLKISNQNLLATIQWIKYQGVGVVGYRLYKSNDGGPPYLLKAFSNIDSTYSDTNIFCKHTYTYQVQGQLINGKTTFSDSVTINAFDTIPPPKEGILVATVTATSKTVGQIQLSFNGNNTKNRMGYYIYRATSKGQFSQAYTLFNTTHGLITWNDPIGLNTVDSAYRYYVDAFDSCNNEAAPLDTHQVIHLKAKAYNQYFRLDWTPYKGWKNLTYKVLKRENLGGWYVYQILGKDILSLIDSNVYCHRGYSYMIKALNSVSNYQSTSDESTDTAINTVPPVVKPIQRATVLKTGVINGKVNISWNASPAKNIEHYKIYRSIDGNNWTEISQVFRRLEMTDSGLNTYGQAYYYKIQPIDSCGNIGDFSQVHKTIQLKASPGNSFNSLIWNRYEGWNVKKYLVIRNANLLTTLSGNLLTYRDTLVFCDSVYHYIIKAVCDTSTDTLFSASNTDSARAFDHIAPERVYLKSVSVNKPNKAATITWLPSPSWDVKNYYIYRKSAATGDMTFIDSTDQTTFTDSTFASTLGVGGIHDPDCYYVFARDHCGNQSPGSNHGCIIILDGKNHPGYNEINWNGYDKWPDGTMGYNVYKNEDGQGWVLIGTTQTGAINQYLDKNLTDTAINFCYQVEAVENNGLWNATSRSTVHCLHQDATVFIPNTFSHYKIDGLNDKFGPKGLYIKNYTMQVYNRWAEQVFNTTNSEQWDGTFRGIDVLQGVYIYYIIVEDFNHHFTRFKGTITIFN